MRNYLFYRFLMLSVLLVSSLTFATPRIIIKNATLIDVFDLAGKDVLSQNVHAGEPITMDLKEIPAGMYYYLIKGEKNETVCSGKMVISR